MRRAERILRSLVWLSALALLIFFTGLHWQFYQRTPPVIKLGEGLILSFATLILTWYGAARWSGGR